MKLQHLILTLAFCCLLPSFSVAQGFSYGLRVGLNFGNMPGDLEKDDAGEEVERLKTNTGFHVGASVRYNFNDRFGVKADLLFSQKGTQQFYEGQGAQLFYISGTENQKGLIGMQDRFLRITNGYIEIPISAYAKFGKIEFFGGPYIGILVSSKAVGEYKFTATNGTVNIVELNSDLNYDYNRDDLFDAANTEINMDDFEVFLFDGELGYYPNVAEAYDDFRTKDGKVFNTIDFGLNAGLAFFINRGLYVSANLNYGLVDVTNKSYDHSYTTLSEDKTQYAERDDVDRNVTVQVSVGFAF